MKKTKRRHLRQVIRGVIRYEDNGDFLEVSRTKDTIGQLAMGALLTGRRWKNKKVRITISEVR